MNLSQALDEHEQQLHREDYPEVAAQGISGEPRLLLSSGLARVIRPGEIAYEQAQEDYFRIEAIRGAQISIQLRLGAHLGCPPLSPVALPPEVAALLRVGDPLRAEVAPRGSLWEVLEATALFPGGYHGATF